MFISYWGELSCFEILKRREQNFTTESRQVRQCQGYQCQGLKDFWLLRWNKESRTFAWLQDELRLRGDNSNMIENPPKNLSFFTATKCSRGCSWSLFDRPIVITIYLWVRHWEPLLGIWVFYPVSDSSRVGMVFLCISVFGRVLIHICPGSLC